jgi:hypothetical protein
MADMGAVAKAVRKNSKKTSKRERELIARVAELTRQLDTVNFIAQRASILESQKDAAYLRAIETAKKAEEEAGRGAARSFALLARLVQSMPKRIDVEED